MKLSQLISQYQALNSYLLETEDENDVMGREADELLARIERVEPKDVHDVTALARLIRHMIEVEDDPFGAQPLLQNITGWAKKSKTSTGIQLQVIDGGADMPASAPAAKLRVVEPSHPDTLFC